MIDLKRLEKDDDYRLRYAECVKNRKMDPALVEQLLQLNKTRKQAITDSEVAKAEQNKIGQLIAQKKRQKENADEEQRRSAELKELQTSLQNKMQAAEQEVQ